MLKLLYIFVIQQNKKTMELDYNTLLSDFKKEDTQNFMLSLGEGYNSSTEEFVFHAGEYDLLFEASHISHLRWIAWSMEEISREDEVILISVTNDACEDLTGDLLVSELDELVDIAREKIVFE